MPVMEPAELEAFLKESFPDRPPPVTVEMLAEGRARVRLVYDVTMLRPGGVMSGPTLMMLSDLGAWAALLADIGPVAMAVTSSLTIHFLRKAPPGDLVAEAEVLRRSRRQAVVDVRIRPAEGTEPVSQSTVTYAIPP